MRYRTEEFTQALTDLAGSCRRLRRQGNPATEVAAHWSAQIRSHLDASLIATCSLGRGESTPGSDIDAFQMRNLATPHLDALREAEIIRLATSADDLISGAEDNDDLAMTGLLADADDPLLRHLAFDHPSTELLTALLDDSIRVGPPRISGPLARHSFALKTEVLTPLTKIARWGALASGEKDCPLSTPERLRATSTDYLSTSHKRALLMAFDTAISLRVDIEFTIVDRLLVDRNGNIMVRALPLSTQRGVYAAIAALRMVQKSLSDRLSISTFSTGR